MFLTREDYQKIQRIIEHYTPKVDLTVKIPLEEYHERYQRVWAEMENRGLDLGYFFWYREMPGDGMYLTGYNPTLEKACGVIAPGKVPLLLVGPESGRWAQEVGLNLPTSFVDEFAIPDEYYEGITYANMTQVIHDYVGKTVKKVANLTAHDVVTRKVTTIFQNVFTDAEHVDASDILEEMRYEKSESEYLCMKQADTIACASIRAALAVLKPGLRELQVAAVIDYVTKSLGAESYGVETAATSGERNRYIIASASNKIIEEGDIVQLSCSPIFQGYKGCCRRTVVAGKRTPLQEEFFQKMNHAYELACAELKNVIENDLPNNRIDLAARDYFATQEIAGQPMKPLHLYSTCHGTGLTECLEKLVIHPFHEFYYGTNVGMMLDLGVYGHPNKEICGGCVESAFFKKGNNCICFTDLPTDVQHLVGIGLE